MQVEPTPQKGQTLRPGDFVRVKETADFRPGQDGMVIDQDDGETVGLIFHCDRYGKRIHSYCEGAELWNLDELDLGSIER